MLYCDNCCFQFDTNPFGEDGLKWPLCWIQFFFDPITLTTRRLTVGAVARENVMIDSYWVSLVQADSISVTSLFISSFHSWKVCLFTGRCLLRRTICFLYYIIVEGQRQTDSGRY